MKKAKKIALIAVFIIGASLLLYPLIGSLINKVMQLEAIRGYEETVNIIDNTENERLYEEAVSYNQKISELQKNNTRYTLADEYESILRINDTGTIGYIEIPGASIKLPIYHGVAENVLQKGVGHVRESSLPIGTTNQNSVLMGHSGLPASELFNNLTNLEVGDYLKITILKRELYYRVYNIEVIEPKDLINMIHVEEGRDLITLVTCTPYGVNTHRLIIHAERYEKEDDEEIVIPTKQPTSLIVSVAILLGASVIAVIYILYRRDKKRAEFIITAEMVREIIKHLEVSEKKAKKKTTGKKKKCTKKKTTRKKKVSKTSKKSTSKKKSKASKA